MALLKTHLETTLSGLDERVARSAGHERRGIAGGASAMSTRAFGLKFWALISGGGALPGPLEQFWNALGFVLVQGYGMTETTALITLNHPFHVARGTIGKPLPGREVKLGPDGEVLVRGAIISGATWSGGALHEPRRDEWLATGDLAQAQPSGELRFLGRKSEVIVTAAGVNLHPEDLEAAIEQEPDVAACAVVAMETAAGPEPCAVLALRGEAETGRGGHRARQRSAGGVSAPAPLGAVAGARPAPHLHRQGEAQGSGRVAGWNPGRGSTAFTGAATKAGAGAFGASTDWLLALIAQISGEAPSGVGDELRLTEDLHLDSLGRVQLAAAIEERLGMAPESGLLEEVQTLGELRQLLAGTAEGARTAWSPTLSAKSREKDGARHRIGGRADEAFPYESEPRTEPAPARYIYPRWPWLLPFRWLRIAFIEAVDAPAGLAAGASCRDCAATSLTADAPLLIVANHVTAYDGPLIQYALPGPIRRRIAVAMSGEMLEDYRHFRNPDRVPGKWRFYLPRPPGLPAAHGALQCLSLGPAAQLPAQLCPRRRGHGSRLQCAGFSRGHALGGGALARFRRGIGLLARQSGAMVLPVAIRGLGELKMRRRGWFRSGILEVHVGQPLRFAPEETESAITARLHAEVEKLLNG